MPLLERREPDTEPLACEAPRDDASRTLAQVIELFGLREELILFEESEARAVERALRKPAQRRLVVARERERHVETPLDEPEKRGRLPERALGRDLVEAGRDVKEELGRVGLAGVGLEARRCDGDRPHGDLDLLAPAVRGLATRSTGSRVHADQNPVPQRGQVVAHVNVRVDRREVTQAVPHRQPVPQPARLAGPEGLWRERVPHHE